MSATPNPLDQLLARAKEAVRQADAAKAAKARAKDPKAAQGVREAAQAEYTQWAEGQAWKLVAKQRTAIRWVCKCCGHFQDSDMVQYFALYEHRVHIGAKREVSCHKKDHVDAPVRMTTRILQADYCVRCS